MRFTGRRRSALATIVCSGLLAIGVAACGSGSSGGSDAKSGGLAVIKVAQNSPVPQAGLAWLWIGSYLGYYKQEGVKVDIVRTSGPQEAIQQLTSGSVQAAVPPPAPVLNAASEGRDLGLITPYMIRRHGQYSIATLPNSPITSPGQIAGKKVGVTTLTDEGANLVGAILRSEGKDASDVKLVPVGAVGQAATELKNGQVDALALPGVQYAQIKGLLHLPIRILPGPAFEKKVVGNAIWFQKSWFQSHKQEVEGYLKGQTKALAFFAANPRAALEIHFKMYPQSLPKGQTVQQAIKTFLPQIAANMPTLRVDDTGCPKYGCNEPSAWKFYVSYLGLDPSKVGNLSRFYTNEMIDAINSVDLNAVARQAKNFKLH